MPSKSTDSSGSEKPNGIFSNDSFASLESYSSDSEGIQADIQTKKKRPLIQRINRRIAAGHPFFSLEFFPPKTVNGALNLVHRCEKMGQGGPLFCDITWHRSGDPTSEKPSSSMMIANAMVNYAGLETMLHMTCITQTESELIGNLERARSIGIQNILALRGDPPRGEKFTPKPDGMNYSTDMIRAIRREFGDYFVVGVAGYPHKHPDAATYDDGLHFLKEKVDCGADFIITQLAFNADRYIQFVKDCRQIGINCPILPGVMPIQSYQSLKTITAISGLAIPEDMNAILEPIKENDEAVRNYGIDHAVQLCQALLDSGLMPGIHIYTLNRENIPVKVLQRLGLWAEKPHRTLPWRLTANPQRVESVRPIFWAHNTKSYIFRTSDWDEYPNGRWGNSSAATFGDFNHHLFYTQKSTKSDEIRRRLWGEPSSERDVWEIFECFVSGMPNKDGTQVDSLPWEEGTLTAESNTIADQLILVNRMGFLTINSQPHANGVPSIDFAIGWGNPGGYIYQKAYLEFFTSRERCELLRMIADESYPSVNYHMMNATGTVEYTNDPSPEPIAVTWGVFPGKEIIQPTVVDPIAFQFWKDEAFSMWEHMWASLYESGSVAREVIMRIHDTYVLVNLVDNEYPKGNCLFDLLKEVNSSGMGTKTRGRDAATLARQSAIDLRQLGLHKKIAVTHSATTWSGVWQGTRITAKVLNLRNCTIRNSREFADEYPRLRIFNHPNVLGVLGVCNSQSPPNLIVLSELMPYGSLFDVLHRDLDLVLDQSRLLRWAHDIALGMEHLHLIEPMIPNLSLNSKHVMVDEDLTARINMASYRFSFHEKSKCYDPAWVAPEALQKASNEINMRAADIWSYAVVLWELVTRNVPFAELSSMEAGMKIAMEGLRIRIPPETSTHISRLIQICMNEDPAKRPRFDMIVPILEKMKQPPQQNQAPPQRPNATS